MTDPTVLSVLVGLGSGFAAFLANNVVLDSYRARVVEDRTLNVFFISASRTYKLMRELEQSLEKIVPKANGLTCDSTFNLSGVPARFNLVSPGFNLMDAMQKVTPEAGVAIQRYLFLWSRILSTDEVYAKAFIELVKCADAQKPGPAFEEYSSQVREQLALLQQQSRKLRLASAAVCVKCIEVRDSRLSLESDDQWIRISSGDLWSSRHQIRAAAVAAPNDQSRASF